MTVRDAQLLAGPDRTADVPGLRRALELLREEARSFPGPEGSAAFAAATRSLERELRRMGVPSGGPA